MSKINKRVFFIVISTIVLSCMSNVKNTYNNKKDYKIKSQLNDSNSLYKDWLKDTMTYLSKWKEEKNLNILRKEIAVANDSSSLSINVLYFAHINKSDRYNIEITNIINLLKENKEYFKNDFNISFNYYYYYYPSSFDDLHYDYVFEIKQLQIDTNDSIFKYGYNRGRITNKKANSKKTKKGINTDFIWDENKLIKKKY